MLAERSLFYFQKAGSFSVNAPGNLQRRFRHPVSRVQGLPTKPARGEPLIKGLERLPMDRLCTHIGTRPRAEIQCLELFISDRLRTELIGKVRRATMRGTISTDQREPGQGSLQEGSGGEEIRREAMNKWLKECFNEPHIVKMGKPGHSNCVVAVLRSLSQTS